MRDNGIAELRIWETCQHRGLHDGHDLAGLGADHREAENAVVTPNKGLHEPLCFVPRLRRQNGAHRYPLARLSNPRPLHLPLPWPDPRHGWMAEQTIQNPPLTRAPLPSPKLRPEN